MVTAVDRGRYRVVVHNDDGQAPVDGPTVTCVRSSRLRRRSIVPGDRVRVVGDTSGADGTMARIVEILDRRTLLRRSADDTDPTERVLVANADQLVIVTALADPPPRTGMIDRILVAAFDARVAPILCLTKADLASPQALVDAYEPLGVPVVTTSPTDDLAPLRDILVGHTSVLVGHSGVGKSTLVNRLIPDAGRETGHVNTVTGRGRHTSTSAVALRIPPGAGEEADTWVIDTPGVRSFGLSHVKPETIILAFPDLAAETDACPRGCTHEQDAPGCGLDEAVAAGRVEAVRVDSYRRMVAHRHDWT